MPTSPVAVIILTFNEAANIGHAVRSVLGWAQEIFIVDSYSTDDTIEQARAAGGDAVQIVQRRFENYSAQWNWALTHLPIAAPWVMKLDADERATPEFRDEVAGQLAATSTNAACDAYVVHWRLVFMGCWLRWGGLYPNGNVRLWRRGRARCEERSVNEHLIVDGPVGEIEQPIEHHDYKSLSYWLDRHNRYASLEARSLIDRNLTGGVEPRLWGRADERRMWLRRWYYRMPCRPLLYFLYRYVLRGGFLDGRPGFRFAFLHAAFLYWIDLKRLEYQQTGVLPEVTWPARGTPHRQIADSPLQQYVDGKLAAWVPVANGRAAA